MKPEEKAKELIDKFFHEVLHYDVEYGYVLAKSCALLCVDEIIVYYPVAVGDDSSKTFNKYWKQVCEAVTNLKT